MDTQTPLSNATWREIDRDTGRLPDTQARRLRWLMPLFLVGVAVLGASGLLHVNLQPPPPPPRPKPAPVFPATDGLPEVLTAGVTYRTSLQVEFPADWPHQDGDAPGMTGAIVIGTGYDAAPPSTGEVVKGITCSAGTDYAAGHSVTLDCIITALSPGPFTLQVSAGTRDAPVSGIDDGQDLSAVRSYQHTVQPPEHA
jgi:hypothetical protein